MTRLIVLTLTCLIAAVPPGFCTGRLTAMFIPSDDLFSEQPESPHDGDDPDGCQCETLIPDAVPSPTFAIAIAVHADAGMVTPFVQAPTTSISDRSFVEAAPPADPPLYL